MSLRYWLAALVASVILLSSCLTVAAPDTVKITPLGSHDGEFCASDRALVLEDPKGLRILYDAGRTVAGADDPRLGKIDVVLISHVHGDHLGDRRIEAVNQGSCAQPQASISTTPNSNSVDIAVKKGARVIVGSEMASFLSRKVSSLGGNPDAVQLVRFGASRTIDGVSFTTVPAVHSNGLSGDFIEGELGENLKAAGLTAYVGPPTGYVVKFSNGLTVYLSGDTGVTAEQETVVRGFYGAKLAVINIGDTFTTGPKEAAYVIDKLIQPAAVIASHANEAATVKGKLQPNTKTATFIAQTKTLVHLPLSGRTIAFDASANCTAGCSKGVGF